MPFSRFSDSPDSSDSHGPFAPADDAFAAWPGLRPRAIPQAWREAMPPAALAALRAFVEKGDYSAIEPWFDLRVGFEIHLRLATGRKLFCDSLADQAGYVDLGLPGSYPELDPDAARLARRLGRALGAQLPERMAFERKRYAYPDLTKGYQTTQKGLCAFHGGALSVPGAGVIEFERGQIEEDAASARRLEDSFEIDCGRAGSPLVEIVTKPMRLDPRLAAKAALAVRDLAMHLGVSGGAPEKAEFKTDVCVSIAPLGLPWGERVEIKGVALFESVERSAISCARMLAELLLAGGQAQASTFRHDEATGELSPMREKQDALYRFLPDGDLGMPERPALDEEETLWNSLPPPGAWLARSATQRGPLVDDPAAESLCWLIALFARQAVGAAADSDSADTAHATGASPLDADVRVAKIEKTVASALSRLRMAVPREPRSRVALARALAWALRAEAAGAPARVAVEIATAAWGGEAFDAKTAQSALSEARSSFAPGRADALRETLAPWLATELAAASWTEYLGGKQKALGSLIGQAKRLWPQEDPQQIGAALRALAALATHAAQSAADESARSMESPTAGVASPPQTRSATSPGDPS